MFKDDATLEEELRKEWSESPEKMTGVEQAEVDELLNGADSADDDDAFVDEEDDFYFDDEYDDDDDLSDDSADDEDDDDYGFNDDESATVGVDDDRMVEVYDERGNLVGIFSGRDYDRIRNKSKN